jgi:hypothetical protein
MLPGRRDGEGRLDVTTDPVGATSTYQGGIALNPLGQVHVVSAAPTKFTNGFGMSAANQLCISSAATVDFLEGLPRTATGALKAQTDTVPDPLDPFVGGIRVGPLGGVYTTLTAPPVTERPENTVRPEVIGIADVGATLTCDTGTWTNNPTAYAYRWFQGNTPIIGANTNIYVVVEADRGSNLVCIVTATNTAGGNSAPSNAVRIGSGRYNYTTSTNQFPAQGNMTAASGSVIIRMNVIDKDGKNFTDIVNQLKPGDSIFVGMTEGVLVNDPYITSGTIALFSVASWVPPADGEYTVTVEVAAS